MECLIIHCLLLVSILGICLILPISLDYKFFGGRGSTFYALAASALSSTVFYVLSSLAILSHPIVLFINSTWDNTYICLSSPDSWGPFPSQCSNHIGVFLFCEHMKLFSMLGFLYFLNSSSPRFLQI